MTDAATDEDIEMALDCGFSPRAAAAQLGVALARVNKVRERIVADFEASRGRS